MDKYYQLVVILSIYINESSRKYFAQIHVISTDFVIAKFQFLTLKTLKFACQKSAFLQTFADFGR